MARRIAQYLALSLLLASTLSSFGEPAPVLHVSKQPDGLSLQLHPGTLRLQVWSPQTIRVTYAPGDALPELKSWSVIASPAHTDWSSRETPDAIFLQTASLQVRVDRKSGAVSFLSPDGQTLLQESDNGKDVPQSSTTAPSSFAAHPVRQSFILPPDEALFGLGQHQQGIMNYRGHTVRLLQQNRDVAVPTLLSNKGYLLLWDNPAITDISVGATRADRTPGDGLHLPQPQPAGENITRWSSETGKAIDYYFCYGPTPDQAIHQYRILTGPAPLLPRYAWGLWQSKERYRSSDELLDIAKKYRDLHIPIDGIIQDWRYWPDNNWGSHQFEKSRYPDPAATFKELHQLHFHDLISVWPKFDLNTPNFNELEQAHALYDPVIPYVFPPGKGKWYDPFNPKGRELYWKQLATELFPLGIDGWWLDASEPELSGKWGEFRNFQTAAGPGADVFNAYPLMHTTAIYQGQRATTSDKRVIILTRSAYAGQQRNSAITWSGDIAGSWQVFKEQIPAGLNFSASGIPYWNTDIGGFFASRNDGNSNPKDPRYAELFTRWFQFGAFCPMFRIHGSAPNGGTGPGKEIFRFPDDTQSTLKNFINLRYQLLPYIYSTSWQVTNSGSSMMRPLVMDFPNDPKALSIPDQYLFGPSILVCPVTEKGATSRQVYLPGNKPWFNFWTNAQLPASQTLSADAPISQIPLFIPAGTILPLGPEVQYANEKPNAPIELRIYPGADAHFTLYEDSGDGYQYEHGQHATIPLSWNDKTQTLTLGERSGSYPNMPLSRTFNIVSITTNAKRTIDYSGQSATANLAQPQKPRD
ncbi:MAG: glycoside hydrolase family 31 protein [Phycisphaerae bacterium]